MICCVWFSALSSSASSLCSPLPRPSGRESARATTRLFRLHSGVIRHCRFELLNARVEAFYFIGGNFHEFGDLMPALISKVGTTLPQFPG